MIAGLARRCDGNISRAEDLVQDAIVAALETWEPDGVPRNPGAWLMATAKNRQIDLARRAATFDGKRAEVARDLQLREGFSAPPPEAGGLAIDDDVLRLIFTCCHPALTRESQVALTLRMVGGLKTEQIARALLTSDATVGQRISRAKRTLADAGSPFELPQEDEFKTRLNGVLAIVYLIYNEGYSATAGEDWMRIDLCEDALRLGRMLQGLSPGSAEVHGLAALMELQSSRTAARTGAGGEAIPLFEQDRARWDRLLIGRGLAALDRALELPGPKGQYTLQAQIAACHARAESADATDWRRIADFYAVLERLTGSPVVTVNRALAVGFAEDPESGLALLASVEHAAVLRRYPYLEAVRGELLTLANRPNDAAFAFERAAELTANVRERETLERRAANARIDAISGESAPRRS